jgi:hypothetical protein
MSRVLRSEKRGQPAQENLPLDPQFKGLVFFHRRQSPNVREPRFKIDFFLFDMLGTYREIVSLLLNAKPTFAETLSFVFAKKKKKKKKKKTLLGLLT